MHLSKLLALAALLGVSTAQKPRIRNHDSHDYYAIHLHDDSSPQEVALALGLDYEGPLGELQGHHTFSSPKRKRHNADAILEDVRRRRRRRKRELGGHDGLEGIFWSQKQKTKPRMVKRNVLPTLVAKEEDAAAATVEDSKTPPGHSSSP